jgi:hypothetical protein
MRKLIARKHVRALPRRNIMPTESHSNGQRVGYFSSTLQTLLLALGYSEPPLFVGTSRLLHGNSYLWRMHVIIYERPTTDHVHHIRQVVEASTPRWTLEGGMRGATWEALVVLRQEADEQIEHSQYRHFPSCTQEGFCRYPTDRVPLCTCFWPRQKAMYPSTRATMVPEPTSLLREGSSAAMCLRLQTPPLRLGDLWCCLMPRGYGPPSTSRRGPAMPHVP